MASAPVGETFLAPQQGDSASGVGASPTGLPADLVSQSAGRLRVIALLYAFVYFFAGFFPALLFPDARARLFATVSYWMPGATSIGLALLVAAVARSRRVPLPLVMSIGLVFEVVSSYFIAAAEFLLEPATANMLGHWMGLSWVAVWTLVFTVVVPTRPRRALLAASASVAAVPVVVGFVMATRTTSSRPDSGQFFFSFVFPYVLVVILAYVAARVVYSLGAEVRRARQLGSYQLVEQLGQGGMGEVWRAKHRLLVRPAAIKLIRPSLTGTSAVSEDIQRRFRQEAQVIARLRSPHTVELFDFGIADDGSFYYVMELLDGLDADALVRRTGPLPAERVIHVIRQMCHSLSEAESCGLVHRDIKPANIFLCRYGEEYDFVKVLDFGLVKATRGVAEAGPALTQEMTVRGTPAFIAPEQALGGSDIDSRADIYATGCVAYWLLTGKLVFTAESPMGLLLHHAKTAPSPPSTFTELPIPAVLEQIVMACLAKDPVDRPQSARELSRRLSEVDIASDWTAERARDWWAMHQPVSLNV